MYRFSWVFAVVLAMFLAGCESSGDGGPCTLVDNGDGTYTMSCPDGSRVTLHDGEPGEPGEDGAPGENCTVTDNGDGTYTVSCPDGSEVVMKDGRDGNSCTVADNEDGTYTMVCDDGTDVTWSDGENGLDGAAGNSCTVEDNEDGTYTMICTDGTDVTFSDGKDGQDAESCTVTDNLDGTYTLSCPDGSEVVLSDGKDGKSCTVLDNEDGTYTMTCDDGTDVTWSDGENGLDGAAGNSCTVEDNEDNTYTLTCPDGSEVTWSGWEWETPVMVTVSGGPFWQGCNASVDDDCYSDEKPYHEVTVPSFEIDKYEVTVGLYGDCVTAGGCTAPRDQFYSSYCNWGVSGKGEHPVNCITWYQSREYCAWAGKRLCSESEWEKASRGTDGRKYPWGNETATCEYAVMDEGGYGCGTDSTWPVELKPAGASPYGALDMSGNVWEWVEDDWRDSYTGAPTNGSAWVDDPRASFRVVRGGGFGPYVIGSLRSSYRSYGDPAFVYVNFGVRCCRSK